MSDAILIAIITGVFGLLGKALDLIVQRSKASESARPKRRGNSVNPTTHGGILNPSTIGLLLVGILVGVLVVRIPGFLHTVPPVTATSEPPATHPAVTETPAGLHVGGHAIIHTTAGDKLRIHKTPEFNGAVTASLENGTRVSLAEGPVTLGTDHWWRVETIDGRTGWAVESVEGIETLVPSE
jgi:hypothetical protein